MNKLIILFLAFDAIYGCLELGNPCTGPADCCSLTCNGICSPPVSFESEQMAPNQGQVSFEQFSKAVTSNGYPAPTKDQYNTVVKMHEKDGGITSKQELAMFLAEVLWESGGLKYKKEIRCAQTNCPGDYRTGREASGKYYYGRGYIQLTWLYNYEACSKALYGDDRLVKNPDLVSNSEEGSWGSAFWFWKTNVHNAPGVQQGHFGAATKAINGALECTGPHKDVAKKRFGLYVKVLKAFGLDNVKPNESGCYN